MSLQDFVDKSARLGGYYSDPTKKGYFHNNNYIAACAAILNDIFYNNTSHSNVRMPSISSLGIKESIEMKENLLRENIKEVIIKNEKN